MFFKKKFSYKNPNKFIIKNNKFVNDFDSLYKSIKDPWNQDKNFTNNISNVILQGILDKFTSKKKIRLLDVGCAYGSLKKIINKKIKYTGTDIHNQKIKDVIFDDITVFNKNFYNRFNVLCCLTTIYYVGFKIKTVLKNFKSYLRKNGLLIISYNLKKNSLSNKYLTDLKLRRLLIQCGFEELYTIEINRELYYKSTINQKITLLIFKKIKT
jgi:2-polyprenyl-3-methyl-5-hydroxy-6-metoxy-1,4-benzoquinol methylase